MSEKAWVVKNVTCNFLFIWTVADTRSESINKMNKNWGKAMYAHLLRKGQVRCVKVRIDEVA